MTDYICARWRDAVTDPPADTFWVGQAEYTDGSHGYVGYDRNRWVNLFAREEDALDITGNVAKWLDVTAIPAVPREAVQAAVLEMRGQPPFGCDTWQVAEDILIKHTGVTPKERE